MYQLTPKRIIMPGKLHLYDNQLALAERTVAKAKARKAKRLQERELAWNDWVAIKNKEQSALVCKAKTT